MNVLPDGIIDRLRAVGRCRPDIVKIAEDMAAVQPAQYDTLAAQLTESGEDHALGILMLVTGLNGTKLDPVVLSRALRVVEDMRDIIYPYGCQDESAIHPLLSIALDESLTQERQVFACRLAVELTVKYNAPRQPARKVLWQLLEDVRAEHMRLMLDDSEEILEGSKEKKTVFPRFTERDLLTDLPEERPPTVIGDGGTIRRPVEKLGRNEPCRCGSGRKYKKCCFDKDQDTLRDASSYEGITASQIRENPSLVDDSSYIERLKPYELKKLVPARMNNEQLFRAYRRADVYGLRGIAFQMLLELKGRPGKDEYAVEHMADLLYSALRSKDVELARRVIPHIPEDERFYNLAYKLRYELLEDSGKFDNLESLCRNAFVRESDAGEKHSRPHEHWLLELSYAFADIMPALSLVFGRAAIVSEPDRHLDNEMLIEGIHKTRIALDLEPWGDPIEDYWDWVVGEADEHDVEQGKDDKIRQLQKELAEARSKSATALGNLREKEQELARLEKKLDGSKKAPPQVSAEQNAVKDFSSTKAVDKTDGEREQEVVALRKKIEGLKQEIGSQQESRRQLRRELQEANEKMSRQGRAQTKTLEPDNDEEQSALPALPEKMRLPVFTEAFYGSCQELPADLVKKAMQSAVGLAFRDDAVMKQTVSIERLPGHYRIKIGSHHRLIVRRTQAGSLEIMDVIQRKEFETWIRQHAG